MTNHPIKKIIIGSNSGWLGNFIYTFYDSDSDGLADNVEKNACTAIFDADTDDDGIWDGEEDFNRNGVVDLEETDPCNVDTDGDGIQDGTEQGYTNSDIGEDTNTEIFVEDNDPVSTTDPTDSDSDDDGLLDGEEDFDVNGAVDISETDPNRVDTDSDGIADNEDNCPITPNPNQSDADNDGSGDACDENNGYKFPHPVPDTGQNKCYDDSDEIPCPEPGEDFYGQDGSYTLNSMSYTKLDASGNELPDDASFWTMVRDNVTGLIWEVKQDKDGTENYANPHDADNTYTWYDSNPDTNGGNAGTPGDDTDTEDFINELNANSYGGHNDWRMPTIKELAYIVDYSISRPGPAINSEYFSNTQGDKYWSDLSSLSNGDIAWPMNFYNLWIMAGTLDYKTNTYYVRAVSGEKYGTLGHLVINSDGTVTDMSTGLMWQQATGPEGYTWKQALDYCEILTLGGYDDWRLPNIKELLSLIDYGNAHPAHTSVFQGEYRDLFFSSTTGATYTEQGWVITFWLGNTYDITKSNQHNCIRAVRCLQPGELTPEDIDNDEDGYTKNEGDCNDENASIHPNANEVCGDGIDQDCNDSDLICPEDIDGDGFDDDIDNCLNTSNPDQQDIDRDGIGDACDDISNIPGDVNGDKTVSIDDLILALQSCAGFDLVNTINLAADVDGDNHIGISEALYIFKKIAGVEEISSSSI
jgi:hypothetical protein